MNQKIFGYDWSIIDGLQRGTYKRPTLEPISDKDYGYDPLPDGTFKMVPSGRIISLEEMKAYFGK